MKLNILYFGLIAEALKTGTEEFMIDTEISVHDLKQTLLEKHPILSNLNYQIAINKKIAKQGVIINQDSEIALLPPFAGG